MGKASFKKELLHMRGEFSQVMEEGGKKRSEEKREEKGRGREIYNNFCE